MFASALTGHLAWFLTDFYTRAVTRPQNHDRGVEIAARTTVHRNSDGAQPSSHAILF
jgi:hypothetical protein